MNRLTGVALGRLAPPVIAINVRRHKGLGGIQRLIAEIPARQPAQTVTVNSEDRLLSRRTSTEMNRLVFTCWKCGKENTPAVASVSSTKTAAFSLFSWWGSASRKKQKPEQPRRQAVKCLFCGEENMIEIGSS